MAMTRREQVLETMRKRSKPVEGGWRYEKEGWIYTARKVDGKRQQEELHSRGGERLPALADDNPAWDKELYDLIVLKKPIKRGLLREANYVRRESQSERQDREYMESRLRALNKED